MRVPFRLPLSFAAAAFREEFLEIGRGRDLLVFIAQESYTADVEVGWITMSTPNNGDKLEQAKSTDRRGWRSVFGLASAEDVRRVDQQIAADLEQIDYAEWR